MSNLVMTMLLDKIWYFSLFGQQFWIFAIISNIRNFQSSADKHLISCINKRVQSRYLAFFMQSSGITVFFLPSILCSSLKCFCYTNFTNEILDSRIMVVVTSLVVPSSGIITFICMILGLTFFTNNIISAIILTIFDQVEVWFSRTNKRSVCTTIWFTRENAFSSEYSGLMVWVLVLEFHVSSGSQRKFGPRLHRSTSSLLVILIRLET